MNRSARARKHDEERRRGTLYSIQFLLLSLLIGGFYWAWLTFGNQGGAPEMTATSPAMIIPAGTDNSTETPRPIPEAREVPAIDGAPIAPETEPEAEPEPAPTVIAEPAVPAPPPTPASLFTDPRWQQTATFPGTDAAGNAAEFSVYVLSGANAWTFGKSGQLDIGGQTTPISELFSASDLTSAYCNQSAVIALGAASFEGDAALNHLLAGRRGRNLVSALGNVSPSCANGQDPARLFVNLGEHRRALACPDNAVRCPEISARQRPVVLISGVSSKAETDYGSALRNAITAHEAAAQQIFPGFQLADYSQFEVNH